MSAGALNVRLPPSNWVSNVVVPPLVHATTELLLLTQLTLTSLLLSQVFVAGTVASNPGTGTTVQVAPAPTHGGMSVPLTET